MFKILTLILWRNFFGCPYRSTGRNVNIRLKIKLKFEAFHPFCELQNTSDLAQIHTHPQWIFSSYADGKAST